MAQVVLWNKAKQLLIVTALLLTFLLPSTASAKLVNRVVAVVNGEIITLFELEKESEAIVNRAPDSYTGADSNEAVYDLKRRVLETMIDRKLVKAQAEKLGIKVQNSDVEGAIEQIKKDHSLTQEQFLEQLEKEGESLEQFRKKLREEVERSRLVEYQVRARIVVAEQRVKEYYEQHKDEFAGTNQVRLKNILIPVNPEDNLEVVAAKEKLARGVLEQIKTGVPFEELAQKYSQGPNASKGGDLGDIDPKDLAPYVQEAIAHLQSGQVTDVISGPYGLQIIKVEAKQIIGVRPFEEVKDEIRRKFYEKQMTEKYETWLKELRATAHIKINF
jgi:peptidyl-prolyl cis-trans isomerase SurA